MKKINLVLSVLVLLLVLAGCKDKPKDVVVNPPVEYPIEVPFEEYSLDGSECKWTNISPKKIVVINSNEELAKYIECTGGGNYPEIDFEKKTLVVALVADLSGFSSYSSITELLLIQLSVSKYDLFVEVLSGFIGVADFPFSQYVAVIVEKLDKESTVDLNISKLT